MVKKVISAFLFLGVLCSYCQQTVYPAWEPGVLEIHHINTGRGDAAFFILPDGTTLLIDAGDTSETHPRTLSDRNAELVPNRTKTAPEWIADYIQQFAPKGSEAAIDYAVITHYHDDHFGEMDSLRKKTEQGEYFLTGITTVGTLIPIKKLIDRGSDFPIDLKSNEVQNRLSDDDYHIIPTLQNYWKFIAYQEDTSGLVHETLVPGKLNQIALTYKPQRFPNFSIRNIAVNGKVWTGEKENYMEKFALSQYPGENNLSTCLKLSYGKFDYFTGGDISGMNNVGETDFDGMESTIAPVVGAVDVASLNHHGNRDSQSKYYVRTLRPRVWVQQNWSSDHPGEEVLRRILSKDLYPGERDIFSTVMLQANKEVIGDKLNTYKSQQGHIVIRVYDNGNTYEVYVLDDTSETRPVKEIFGPYESR